jgi:hypothetical protein
MENTITCTVNCDYREAGTLFTLEMGVIFGI